jgi:hypothetical protein
MIAEAHRHGMRVTGHCSHLLPLVAGGMDAKEHIGMCEARGDTYMYDDMIQLFRQPISAWCRRSVMLPSQCV